VPIRIYGGVRVELSNLDKVFFPDAGLTKGDLVDYYARVADWLIPRVTDRPLSLERYPDGIEVEGFFQKRAPDSFPDWIPTVRVRIQGEGGSQSQVVCNDKATLVYLANLACITPHMWLSRRDRLDEPDRMILDLDPPSDDFAPVRDAARAARGLLDRLDLRSYVMLTGSKGAHVVVPLRRHWDFDRVRNVARAIAERLAAAAPERLTVEQRKDKRGDRVFLDTGRNAYGQTAVAPYAVRARPGAPVATPIDWDELSGSTSSSYNVKNLFRRLSHKSDPWREIDDDAQTLTDVESRLKELGHR
jgi:bifunctional non-homologous end joining protein LigD